MVENSINIRKVLNMVIYINTCESYYKLLKKYMMNTKQLTTIVIIYIKVRVCKLGIWKVAGRVIITRPSFNVYKDKKKYFHKNAIGILIVK